MSMQVTDVWQGWHCVAQVKKLGSTVKSFLRN